MDRKAVRSTLIGAAFLMATSAIGPGFLTQTAVFTERLGASFAFAILISVIVDLVAQLNIWRVLAVSARRAQDVRSEERRVGKECRSWWWREQQKKTGYCLPR